MSADKYPCIFSRQLETIVYIVATRTFDVLETNFTREDKLTIQCVCYDTFGYFSLSAMRIGEKILI